MEYESYIPCMEGPTTVPTLFLKGSVLILLYNARPVSGSLQSGLWPEIGVHFVYFACVIHVTPALQACLFMLMY